MKRCMARRESAGALATWSWTSHEAVPSLPIIVNQAAERTAGVTLSPLYPVLLLEEEVKDDRDDDHAGDREDEAPLFIESRIRHVHSVEARDKGWNRHDGGPAGDLLRDDVHPVALDSKVGLQDAISQIPQAVGPLGDPQDMIVEVLVIRVHLVGYDMQVTSHQGVHHLAHGQYNPAQQ